MTGGGLDAGRRAVERRAWAEAHEHLSAVAAAGDLDPGDLELLATAAYMSGHDDDSAAAWARAHHAHLDAGRPAEAVRCAFWLGFGLLQRGDVAQGSGWVARARSLVGEHDLDCVECGYLLLPDGLAAMAHGDHERALVLFNRAGEAARRFGEADLAALARLGRGQAVLESGRGAEGVALLDEAMVAVTAGEVSPPVAGIVYCAVIDLCQQVFDVRRAGEWTAALTRWCDAQPGLVAYRGQCLVHRAQVMQLRGAWRDALDEARRAQERLAEPPHPAVGLAHYQLGELHRLRGEPDRAEEQYRRANEFGRTPQPGLALLRLAQGRVDAAVASIERALDEAADGSGRAVMLPAYVEIMLAADRVPAAGAAARDLAELAAGAGAPYLAAAAAHARGAVLLAEGEHRAALAALRDALRAWHEVGAPYEEARARLLLGAACRAVGDRDGADLEVEAAQRAFAELGAAPAHDGLTRARGAAGGDRPAIGVTPRELEVLRLVARGRTNREIADELVISERTVERHLSNIFTRLGVPNRAAATAYAYDRGLV
ncbi:MAG TPA: LuxR family transcriptional regulator [Acidimicrobiales bacterium]